MDDIVKQAMAKWPKVPHCYGWLALDARGHWHMLDERAQALGLSGDEIRHPALLAFIQRNYAKDERGCWYFQNGPQRVYVRLAVTPHVMHLDPVHGLRLHTGELAGEPDAAWLTDSARLIVKAGEIVACLDDRDLITLLDQLTLHGHALEEDALAAWQANPDQGLCWHWQGQSLNVQAMAETDLATRFGFQPRPRP